MSPVLYRQTLWESLTRFVQCGPLWRQGPWQSLGFGGVEQGTQQSYPGFDNGVCRLQRQAHDLTLSLEATAFSHLLTCTSHVGNGAAYS